MNENGRGILFMVLAMAVTLTSIPMLLGAAIITGSGIYTFLRERRVRA